MKTPCKNLGRPPAKAGQDRRAQLLDAAFILFAEQGVAATTIAQVAHAADVTPAMAHYYFSSRDGLIDAFIEERVAPIIARIWKTIPLEHGTINDILTSFVDCLLDEIERAPSLPKLWSREILNTGGLLRKKAMMHFPKERFAACCRLFAEAQNKGLIRAEIIPSLVFSAVIGAVMLPASAHDLLENITSTSLPMREKLREHVLAFILHGILSDTGDAS